MRLPAATLSAPDSLPVAAAAERARCRRGPAADRHTRVTSCLQLIGGCHRNSSGGLTWTRASSFSAAAILASRPVRRSSSVRLASECSDSSRPRRTQSCRRRASSAFCLWGGRQPIRRQQRVGGRGGFWVRQGTGGLPALRLAGRLVQGVAKDRVLLLQASQLGVGSVLQLLLKTLDLPEVKEHRNTVCSNSSYSLT